MNNHQLLASTLLARGFYPIRLEPQSKAPRSVGWQTQTPTPDSVRRDFARASNIGVRLGDEQPDRTRLVAIDIDCEIAELIGCVEKAIGCFVPVKQGKKGYTYFVRIDDDVKPTNLAGLGAVRKHP